MLKFSFLRQISKIYVRRKFFPQAFTLNAEKKLLVRQRPSGLCTWNAPWGCASRGRPIRPKASTSRPDESGSGTCGQPIGFMGSNGNDFVSRAQENFG